MATREDLRWAAAVFDCEGFFTGGRRGVPPRSIQVSTLNRWILDELARIFGGTVLGPYGPYASSTPSKVRRPIFRWALHGPDAARFLRAVAPRLSPSRREQAEEFLARVEARS